PVGARSALRCGTAKLRTVESTEINRTGSNNTASAAQARREVGARCRNGDVVGMETPRVNCTVQTVKPNASRRPLISVPRPSSRDVILDALQQLLIEQGLPAVTLEKVAAAANVSKGGLLYHFPTKEALITGLAQRLADAADAGFERAATTDVVVGFYLRASLPSSPDRALFWSLLAALRTNDVASAEARRLIIYCFARWAEILTERIDDPVTA